MGRGKALKSLELIAAARRILEEIQPCGVRAVCYRLFVAKLINSMAKNNTNNVSRLLTDARDDPQYEFDWDWIVDATRPKRRVSQWRDFGALMRAAQLQYRRSYWQDQPELCAVWSEKNTVEGTLAPVLDQYGVDFLPLKGNSSTTIVREESAFTWEDERTLNVFYLGDYDPRGMSMSERDLPRRLTKYQGNINFRRIALTEADTRQLGRALSFPASDKQTDTCYPWFVANYGDWCWELDALNPNVLRARVEEAIRSVIDWDAWNRAMRVEAAERVTGEEFLKGWNQFAKRRIT